MTVKSKRRGINYACDGDVAGLNSKHYNLCGDVIVTTDSAGNVLSQSHYEAYGEHTDFGTMPTDKHRANTKMEDTETNLLLEGYRYRLLGHPIFLTPAPLEYLDGLNFYAYCGFNPWGRWDPLGLKEEFLEMTVDPETRQEIPRRFKESDKDRKEFLKNYNQAKDRLRKTGALGDAIVDELEYGDTVYEIKFKKGATPGASKSNQSVTFDPYSENLGADNIDGEGRDADIVRNQPGAMTVAHEAGGHIMLGRKDDVDERGEHNVADTDRIINEGYNATLQPGEKKQGIYR